MSEQIHLLKKILKNQETIMSAIDDLNTAISEVADSVTAALTSLTAALAKPDDTAAIEAAVARLHTLNDQLKASVAPTA